MYEYALEESQQYKEGQVILEKRLIKEIANTVDVEPYDEGGNVPQYNEAL